MATSNFEFGKVNSDIGQLNDQIGNVALPTTAQTLTGAIAENHGQIATVDSKYAGIKIVSSTYTNFTLNANARTVIYIPIPSVPSGYTAYLIGCVIGINTKIYFMGIDVSAKYAVFWNDTGTSYAGTDFPLYATWLILPN